MAVMAINAPGVKHALVVDQLMPRTPHVIHDFILAALLKSTADAARQVIKNFAPGDALPFPFTAFACAPQWIKDALRIVDLIDSGWPFGAIASPAAGMRGIAFKLLHPHLVFV